MTTQFFKVVKSLKYISKEGTQKKIKQILANKPKMLNIIVH